MSWIALAPKLIALFAAVIQYAIAAKQRGLGRAEAVAEALALATEQVSQASAIRITAKSEHVANADDTAFDHDFRRKD